jgi:hypothetical protein
LSGLHGDLQNVGGPDFGGAGDFYFEIAERTIEPKTSGLVSERFRRYNQGDGPSGAGETGTDEASDTSRPENHVVQAVRHLGSNVLRCRSRQALQNFGLTQRVVAGFGALVDAIDNIVGGGNAAPFQPEQDI